MQSFRQKHGILYSFTAWAVNFFFIFSMVMPVPVAYAQAGAQDFVPLLPAPGTMVNPTPVFIPPVIKGIKIFPDDPLRFDFIIDTGDSRLQAEALNKESIKLIKYFLASLTVPEENLWVNLSPYEKDRIITDDFSRTEMGRDLLAQDYLLKQITASLMFPEEDVGREFWDKVYQKAYELYGTTEIPVNTFNKVWIVPEKAVVYQNGETVFVAESRLKVLLEEDYMAMEHNSVGASGVGAQNFEPLRNFKSPQNIEPLQTNNIQTDLIREIILPELEKEVNEGKSFAPLRQIYNSMILATWFKRNLKKSFLGEVYFNKGKTEGIEIEDKTVKEKIYNQYLEAFKQGVYNYIREDYDQATQQLIPRKYFSGGIVGFDPGFELGETQASSAVSWNGKGVAQSVKLVAQGGSSSPVMRDLVDSLISMSIKNKPKNPALIKEIRSLADKIDQGLIAGGKDFLYANLISLQEILKDLNDLDSRVDLLMGIHADDLKDIDTNAFTPSLFNFINAAKKISTTAINRVVIVQHEMQGGVVTIDPVFSIKVQRVADTEQIKKFLELLDNFIVSPVIVEGEEEFSPEWKRAEDIAFLFDLKDVLRGGKSIGVQLLIGDKNVPRAYLPADGNTEEFRTGIEIYVSKDGKTGVSEIPGEKDVYIKFTEDAGENFAVRLISSAELRKMRSSSPAGDQAMGDSEKALMGISNLTLPLWIENDNVLKEGFRKLLISLAQDKGTQHLYTEEFFEIIKQHDLLGKYEQLLTDLEKTPESLVIRLFTDAINIQIYNTMLKMIEEKTKQKVTANDMHKIFSVGISEWPEFLSLALIMNDTAQIKGFDAKPERIQEARENIKKISNVLSLDEGRFGAIVDDAKNLTEAETNNNLIVWAHPDPADWLGDMFLPWLSGKPRTIFIDILETFQDKLTEQGLVFFVLDDVSWEVSGLYDVMEKAGFSRMTSAGSFIHEKEKLSGDYAQWIYERTQNRDTLFLGDQKDMSSLRIFLKNFSIFAKDFQYHLLKTMKDFEQDGTNLLFEALMINDASVQEDLRKYSPRADGQGNFFFPEEHKLYVGELKNILTQILQKHESSKQKEKTQQDDQKLPGKVEGISKESNAGKAMRIVSEESEVKDQRDQSARKFLDQYFKGLREHSAEGERKVITMLDFPGNEIIKRYSIEGHSKETALAGKGGVLVGTGAGLVLEYILKGEFDEAYILDINPLVTEIIWPMMRILYQENDNRVDFLSSLYSVDFSEQEKNRLKRRKGVYIAHYATYKKKTSQQKLEKNIERFVALLKPYVSADVRDELERIVTYVFVAHADQITHESYGSNSNGLLGYDWNILFTNDAIKGTTSSQSMYAKMRKILNSGSVHVMTGDFTGEGLKNVADRIRSQGKTISALYLSNILGWSKLSYTDLLENLQTLPVSEDALVIRTVAGNMSIPNQLFKDFIEMATQGWEVAASRHSMEYRKLMTYSFLDAQEIHINAIEKDKRNSSLINIYFLALDYLKALGFGKREDSDKHTEQFYKGFDNLVHRMYEKDDFMSEHEIREIFQGKNIDEFDFRFAFQALKYIQTLRNSSSPAKAPGGIDLNPEVRESISSSPASGKARRKNAPQRLSLQEAKQRLLRDLKELKVNIAGFSQVLQDAAETLKLKQINIFKSESLPALESNLGSINDVMRGIKTINAITGFKEPELRNEVEAFLSGLSEEFHADKVYAAFLDRDSRFDFGYSVGLSEQELKLLYENDTLLTSYNEEIKKKEEERDDKIIQEGRAILAQLGFESFIEVTPSPEVFRKYPHGKVLIMFRRTAGNVKGHGYFGVSDIEDIQNKLDKELREKKAVWPMLKEELEKRGYLDFDFFFTNVRHHTGIQNWKAEFNGLKDLIRLSGKINEQAGAQDMIIRRFEEISKLRKRDVFMYEVFINLLEKGEQFQSANIVPIVEERVAVFQEAIEQKGLTLDVEIDSKELIASSIDLNYLRLVIDNLLANAIKYTDKGGIKVRLFQLKEDVVKHVRERGDIVLEVADSGIGIPEEDGVQSIFTPGWRAENVGDRPGTGLGLGTVDWAVFTMKGYINVESELGKGSTFRVSFKPAENESQSSPANTPGGIDLNPNRLELQTQGEGVDFNIPFDADNLQSIPINGFTPVIFQTVPISDFPLWLGEAETEESEDPLESAQKEVNHRLAAILARKES